MTYTAELDMSPIPNGSSTQYSDTIRPSMLKPKIAFQYRQSAFLAAEPVPTGATNAVPCVVTTSAPHGLVTGMNITPSAFGMSFIDDINWTLTVLTTTTFELDGSDTALDTPYTGPGTLITPSASLTVSVEGSVTGTDWVEIVAGVADPVKTIDAPAWPYMRLKAVITNGNQDTYKFDIFEQAESA